MRSEKRVASSAGSRNWGKRSGMMRTTHTHTHTHPVRSAAAPGAVSGPLEAEFLGVVDEEGG